MLKVLLDKRQTTYKQVSDLITSTEVKKLERIEAAEQLYRRSRMVGTKHPIGMEPCFPTVSNEEKRKRIKNLRRRVYDSLNVLLACDIFIKNRKKVVLNPEFLKFLPESLKHHAEEDSDKDASADEDKSIDIKAEAETIKTEQVEDDDDTPKKDEAS